MDLRIALQTINFFASKKDSNKLQIPAFPEFKKLEITDRAPIDSYTEQFKPYSDFNFTNLWAWDTRGKRLISTLNGNLVVIFTDYITSLPVLSFIGKYDLSNTAAKLIAYAKGANIDPVLRFIPEEVALGIDTRHFTIEEDGENFDYIFSTEQLSESSGVNFKKKRQMAHKFEREFPEAEFFIQDLRDNTVQQQIRTLFHKWMKDRQPDTHYDLTLESDAFNRLLESASSHALIVSTVYLQNELLAFSIDELLPEGYAISHFLKADRAYKGVYEYLNAKTARYLHERGVEQWNWEQDLNIEGLRHLKMSYRPVSFLKKYKISLP